MKKSRLSAFILICSFALAALMLPASAKEVKAETVCTTLEEAGRALRDALVRREATPKVLVDFDFVLSYSTKEVLNEARKYTGPGSSNGVYGDYLRKSILAGTTRMSTESASGDNYYLVYKIPGYYTNLEEENRLTAALVNEYNTYGVSGKSEIEKIKIIYDDIAAHVKYDTEEGNSSTMIRPRSYSAYGALYWKTAVCQGYAALFYRMCNEQGIACRIVEGTANGSNGQEDHAWNVVKVGSNWYNVDVTWDAVYKQAGKPYQYFLKCNSDFKEHWRDSEYTSSSFNAACPMASASYQNASLGINTGSSSSGSSGGSSSSSSGNSSSGGSVTKYKLTVTNGSGGGSYNSGTVVEIRANAAPSGQVFSRWEGSATFTSGSATSSVAKVKVTSNITLKATYKAGEVTVKNGAYKLNCKSNSKYLVVKKDSAKVNAPIVPGNANAKTSTYKVSKSGSFYYIMNKKTKKYVSLKGNKVVQAKKNSTSKWKMVSTGDGYFKLVNQNGKVVTVSGKSTTGTADSSADNKKIKLVS